MNAPSTPSPAISFIGRKNSGKTTLLEKLIANLSDKGLRIATTLTLIFQAAILIVIAQRVPKVPRFFPMYVLRK